MARQFFCAAWLLGSIALAGCMPQANEANRAQANLERGEAGIVAAPPAADDNNEAAAPAADSVAASDAPASAPASPSVPAATGEYAVFAPPVGLYYETEDNIAAILDEVAKGLPPAEAAPRLQALAGEFRLRIRPYWLWVATATNDQKSEMAQQRGQMLAAKSSRPPPLPSEKMIELARQPGNEAFKAALAATFQAQADQAPRLHAANAQKMLDQLNQ